MLKKHGQIFQAALFLMDMAIISLSWVSAYYLRFYLGPVPAPKGIAALGPFLKLLVFLLPSYALVFKYSGLYEPMRYGRRGLEIRRVSSASLMSLFAFTTLIYLFMEYRYSRAVFIYFLPLQILFLIIFRYSLRILFGWLRSHGYNLRHVLIVGDGRLAQEVARKIKEHAEYGFRVIGFLSSTEAIGSGNAILGSYKQIKEIIHQYRPDQIIITLPFEQLRLLKPILGQVYDEMVEIKVVPDLSQYFTLRQGIEVLDGLPIINLRESPLYGLNLLLKRGFDFFVSLAILCLMSPVMLVIAGLIKLSGPGTVFYRQQRMGLDSRIFEMLKFRSMQPDAESQTGAVWAKESDPRVTRIGRLLRRYNLDELPQFLNVLKGQMSIVGPRPERPEFMQEFKKRIPGYMLRHKMKAGITGWAQANGLRGNTSLEERTQYDLYYIQNWSFLFDLRIFFRSFLSLKNAY